MKVLILENGRNLLSEQLTMICTSEGAENIYQRNSEVESASQEPFAIVIARGLAAQARLERLLFLPSFYVLACKRD
jgi:hypothetical protein